MKKGRFIALLGAAVITASSVFSMGNVEAKWGECTRYCSEDNVEFWYHCNGYGDDEPILYLKKNAKLKYYPKYYTGNAEQAYCNYIKWKRNGYMDVHYLSSKKVK